MGIKMMSCRSVRPPSKLLYLSEIRSPLLPKYPSHSPSLLVCARASVCVCIFLGGKGVNGVKKKKENESGIIRDWKGKEIAGKFPPIPPNIQYSSVC